MSRAPLSIPLQAAIVVALASGCDARFSFDVPSGVASDAGRSGALGSGAGGSDAGAAVGGAAGRVTANGNGGDITTAGSATLGGVSGNGGSSSAAGGSPYQGFVFPNTYECTHHCSDHGLTCATQWLVCVECNADEDCSRTPRHRCDAVLHRCVECGLDLDCPLGYACQADNRCVQKCSIVEYGEISDTDVDTTPCANGAACDIALGQCVECQQDGDCSVSLNGKRCYTATHECVGCLADADCAGTTPYCDPIELRCVACRNYGDCQSRYCNSVKHICE